MLDEIQDLKASERPRYLLTVSLDRLSRDILDNGMIFYLLRERGIEVYTRDDGFVQTDSFAEIAALTGRAMGAHAEREGPRLLMKGSWARRRHEGNPTSNKVPYGLQVQNERDTASEQSSDYVRLAFELYASGIGTPTIAKRFRMEAPPHRVLTQRFGRDGNRIIRGRHVVWEYNRILKLPHQPRYRGVVVEPELFDRVQTLLAARPKIRQKQQYEYPLSGAIQCAGCGGHFHGACSGGTMKKRLASGEIKEYKSKRVRHYSCIVCEYRINAEAVEATFHASLDRLEASPALLERRLSRTPAKSQNLRTVKNRIAELKRALDKNVLDANRRKIWEILLSGPTSLQEDAGRQMEALKEQQGADRALLEQLEEEQRAGLGERRNRESALRLIRSFSQLYGAASYPERRDFANAVVRALGGAFANRSAFIGILTMVACRRPQEALAPREQIEAAP